MDHRTNSTNSTSDLARDRTFFVSLGMFIIDRFAFSDLRGVETGKRIPPQECRLSPIGGGGTYASIGARIWLSPENIGMIVDKGVDFPHHIEDCLLSYGSDMWLFRQHHDRQTTCALNSYRGQLRSFEYLTPRIRLTPRDSLGTRLARPSMLHFICSPTRALQIISEVNEVDGWNPIMIFEPIPDRCVPEELPSLITAMPSLAVLSPNAEEAFSLLSITSAFSRESVQAAAVRFLALGVGPSGNGSVIIRSAALGACVATREHGCTWVDAFWTSQDESKVVDVTGAGNSFLGGLAAGLLLADNDIYQAALYASVSASFTIEQYGLPKVSFNPESGQEEWNNDSPRKRLEALRHRHSQNRQ